MLLVFDRFIATEPIRKRTKSGILIVKRIVAEGARPLSIRYEELVHARHPAVLEQSNPQIPVLDESGGIVEASHLVEERTSNQYAGAATRHDISMEEVPEKVLRVTEAFASDGNQVLINV